MISGPLILAKRELIGILCTSTARKRLIVRVVSTSFGLPALRSSQGLCLSLWGLFVFCGFLFPILFIAWCEIISDGSILSFFLTSIMLFVINLSQQIFSLDEFLFILLQFRTCLFPVLRALQEFPMAARISQPLELLESPFLRFSHRHVVHLLWNTELLLGSSIVLERRMLKPLLWALVRAVLSYLSACMNFQRAPLGFGIPQRLVNLNRLLGGHGLDAEVDGLSLAVLVEVHVIIKE